jgi:hypothetical protein
MTARAALAVFPGAASRVDRCAMRAQASRMTFVRPEARLAQNCAGAWTLDCLAARRRTGLAMAQATLYGIRFRHADRDLDLDLLDRAARTGKKTARLADEGRAYS